MTAATDAPSGIKVPVWRVTKEVWRAVFGNLRALAELAWFPALGYAAVTFAFDHLIKMPLLIMLPPTPSPSGAVVFGNVLRTVLLLAATNIFAVRWHRLLLLNERTGGWEDLFSRQWRLFMLYELILMLPYQAAGLISWLSGTNFISAWIGLVWGLGQFAIAIAFLAFGVFAFGVSLIFPAAAVGHPIGWRDGWQLMEGNFWRLFGCFILVDLPFIIVSLITESPSWLDAIRSDDVRSLLTQESSSGLKPLASTGFEVLSTFVGAALFASVLCAFYRRIVVEGSRGA